MKVRFQELKISFTWIIINNKDKMSIRELLEKSLYDSMRNHDDLTKNTVKLVISAIKFFEIENKLSASESDVLSIIQKEVKIRKETIAELNSSNREDLIEKANNELAVLQSFLPEQLSDDEIRAIAAVVASDISARTASDIGKVMKILVPQLKGKAAPDRISLIVRELLS